MLFDIRTRPEQLQKLGQWVSTGENMADVELVADDRMLLAEQGDERMAWDLDGSPASEQYLERAPLDGPPRWNLMTEQQLVQTVRAALVELRERVEGEGRMDDLHTLDLVCDRWDEFEQEIGTDQIPTTGQE